MAYLRGGLLDWPVAISGLRGRWLQDSSPGLLTRTIGILADTFARRADRHNRYSRVVRRGYLPFDRSTAPLQ